MQITGILDKAGSDCRFLRKSKPPITGIIRSSRITHGCSSESASSAARPFGRSDGQWIVTPAPGTVNETLLNGAPLTTSRPLNDGDVLAAGRSAKGISKLPLTARAG